MSNGLDKNKAASSDSKAKGLMEYTYLDNGSITVRMNGAGVKSAHIDIYCGESKRENIKLLMGADGYFTGGPIRPCRANVQMKIVGNRVISSRNPQAIINNGSGNIERISPPSPNPREGRWELSPDKPLMVNTRKKHYYSRRSRTQGEKDLQGLCGKSKLEETYIFVEGIDHDGNKAHYWYEVGEKETLTNSTAILSSEFFRGIRADFKEITGMSNYHFHPKDLNDGKQYRCGKKLDKICSNAGCEYPSHIDISSYLKTALTNTDISFGFVEGIYDNRVVTSTGVFVLRPKFNFIRSNQKVVESIIKDYHEYFQKFINITKRAFEDLSQSEVERKICKGCFVAVFRGFI